jgi:hypothetical protein
MTSDHEIIIRTAEHRVIERLSDGTLLSHFAGDKAACQAVAQRHIRNGKAGIEVYEVETTTVMRKLVDRFRHLPLANEEPAHPLASYYCDECGEPDWADTHQGGPIREFYDDDEMGDTICEQCMRKRIETTTIMREVEDGEGVEA